MEQVLGIGSLLLSTFFFLSFVAFDLSKVLVSVTYVSNGGKFSSPLLVC